MRKPTSENASLMVTPFAEFYRCDGDQGMRYYPKTGDKRATAIDYSGGTMPPTVKGFAVYDTTVSADYAVALYGTETDAKAHKAVDVPHAPSTIFDNDDDRSPEEKAIEAEEDNATTARYRPKKSKSSKD